MAFFCWLMWNSQNGISLGEKILKDIIISIWLNLLRSFAIGLNVLEIVNNEQYTQTSSTLNAVDNNIMIVKGKHILLFNGTVFLVFLSFQQYKQLQYCEVHEYFRRHYNWRIYLLPFMIWMWYNLIENTIHEGIEEVLFQNYLT